MVCVSTYQVASFLAGQYEAVSPGVSRDTHTHLFIFLSCLLAVFGLLSNSARFDGESINQYDQFEEVVVLIHHARVGRFFWISGDGADMLGFSSSWLDGAPVYCKVRGYHQLTYHMPACLQQKRTNHMFIILQQHSSLYLYIPIKSG